MAYKDEYEVARLYTDGDFLRAGRRPVRGRLRAALPSGAAAPGRARSGNRASARSAIYGAVDADGVPPPRQAARSCAARAFDPFGRTAERRAERRLVADYEALLDEIAAGLSPANHAAAVELAALPLEIRGFGHVKEANRVARPGKRGSAGGRFRSPPAPRRWPPNRISAAKLSRCQLCVPSV